MNSHVSLKVQDYQPLERGGLAAGGKVSVTDSGKDNVGIGQVAWTSVHNDPANCCCNSYVSDASDFSEKARLTRGNFVCYGKRLAGAGTALLGSGEILPYGCYLTAGAVGQIHVDDFLGAAVADDTTSADAVGSAMLGRASEYLGHCRKNPYCRYCRLIIAASTVY